MLSVHPADTPARLAAVRGLMQEFLAWHRERHVADLRLVNAYFDQSAWDTELAALPGPYAPPAGRLLLASWDGEPAGCVALKPCVESGCEMKRMFVVPRLHGRGIGRALAVQLLVQAQLLGYRSMRLDTSVRQREALGLYRSLGFVETAPPPELSPALREWLVFMVLSLRVG